MNQYGAVLKASSAPVVRYGIIVLWNYYSTDLQLFYLLKPGFKFV